MLGLLAHCTQDQHFWFPLAFLESVKCRGVKGCGLTIFIDHLLLTRDRMSQQFQNITLVEVTTSRQVLSRVIMDQGELIYSFIP